MAKPCPVAKAPVRLRDTRRSVPDSLTREPGALRQCRKHPHTKRPTTVLEHRRGPWSQPSLERFQPMKSTITIRSWGALLIAAFFGAITARTLFDDVLTGTPITVAHLQSLAAVVGALASGHMLVPMLKQAKLATLLGMAIIFVSSTAYVVISAGARNSIATQAKQIDAERQNADYAAALDKLADAEADLKAAKDKAKQSAAEAAAECKTGKGKKCEGREATRDYDAKQVEKAESHALMMQARVKVTKPVADPHAGYAHAAKVLAALPYVTAEPDEIERRLDLLLPFATVLISEIALLVFGGLAIGHRVTTPKPERVPATPAIPGKHIPGKPQPPNGGRRGRKSDPRVVSFSEAFSRKHGRAPTGSEIKAQFPELPTSTAYDYAARARAAA